MSQSPTHVITEHDKAEMYHDEATVLPAGAFKATCACGWNVSTLSKGGFANSLRAHRRHIQKARRAATDTVRPSPQEGTMDIFAPGTTVDLLPETDGSTFANPRGWTVVGPTRHAYAVVVREPDHGTTVHVDRRRVVPAGTPLGLAAVLAVSLR